MSQGTDSVSKCNSLAWQGILVLATQKAKRRNGILDKLVNIEQTSGWRFLRLRRDD
jgi:hypothetical protein